MKDREWLPCRARGGHVLISVALGGVDVVVAVTGPPSRCLPASLNPTSLLHTGKGRNSRDHVAGDAHPECCPRGVNQTRAGRAAVLATMQNRT